MAGHLQLVQAHPSAGLREDEAVVQCFATAALGIAQLEQQSGESWWYHGGAWQCDRSKTVCRFLDHNQTLIVAGEPSPAPPFDLHLPPKRLQLEHLPQALAAVFAMCCSIERVRVRGAWQQRDFGAFSFALAELASGEADAAAGVVSGLTGEGEDAVWFEAENVGRVRTSIWGATREESRWAAFKLAQALCQYGV